MSIAQQFRFYLIAHKPETVFTGRVYQQPLDPYMTLYYSTGVTGTYSPLPGMTAWFGSSAGARDYGVLRLRSWTPSGTFGTISVAESDDVGPLIVSGTYITIKNEWRCWSVYPHIVIGTNGTPGGAGAGGTIIIGSSINSGAAGSTPPVTFYEDRDIAWNRQTIDWYPQAVAGPPAVVFLAAGQAQANFIGDRSRAYAEQASIVSYLWQAPFSVEGSSTSQGTQASPVTFTYTSQGQKRVSLTVTDSNGNSSTVYTWVFVVDPANPTQTAFLDFDNLSDNHDKEQGGGQASFTVYRDATITDFPEECMILHATEQDIPNADGYWPFRDNVHFVGYVIGNSVTQRPARGVPGTSEVNFRAHTLDGVMRQTTGFPISLTDKIAPLEWTQGDKLNVNRVSSFIWRWRSTLHFMAPGLMPADYTPLINRQDFGYENIQQMISTLLRSCWGKLVCDHQSVLWHIIDYNLQTASERATGTSTTLSQIHKGIWVDDVAVEERSNYILPVNQCKMSGVAYPGNEVTDLCPLFSEAPGDAPKYFGNELNYDRLILSTQADLNTRSGLGLAKANPRFSAFTMRFLNDGRFNTGRQDIFPANIESVDNDRGISFTGNLLVSGINRQFDHLNGTIITDVRFEPVTTGPAGVTVDVDCEPPDQKLRGGDVPDTPEDAYDGQGGDLNFALASASNSSSFYFNPTIPQAWQRRINGLSAGQLDFLDMTPDPWTYFKNGQNIDRVILWGCGEGFVVVSDNTGQTWVDRTSYLGTIPNSWGDANGPLITGTFFRQIEGDIFRENRAYLLAEAKLGQELWRAWIGVSSDNLFNWDWLPINGAADAQARVMRCHINQGDGTTLWITTWRDGTVYLEEYLVSATGITFSQEWTLSSNVSESEITYKTIYAAPYGPIGNPDLIYVYGRMRSPQGLTAPTGTAIAIIEMSTGSWRAIANDWAQDYCGSFIAGGVEGGGDTRPFWAVRQGGVLNSDPEAG